MSNVFVPASTSDRFGNRDHRSGLRFALEPLEGRLLLSTTVSPTVETDPVHYSGDAADDIAIWVHPSDPARSTIIGTDKAEDFPGGGGIAVYDLSGNELQYRAEGDINNVDLRYNFPLDGDHVTIVAASNADRNSINLYTVNPRTRKLEKIAARILHSGLERVYGLTMYHSEKTGKFYVFVNDMSGQHEQWELFDNGQGRVDGRVVRTFDVGKETEGMVADDKLGYLFVAEEDTGIWRIAAEPGNTAKTRVASVGEELTADVEGLAIYNMPDGDGYLIASSQGSSDFAVFERHYNYDYLGRFRIGGDTQRKVDRVTHTDGIDVANVSLGPRFPNGVFVAQDDSNGKQNQNFKLVPWESIATPLSLAVDTSQDPRLGPHLEDNGVLRVLGTGGDDSIALELDDRKNQIVVNINANDPWRFDAGRVRRVAVDAGAGDDRVEVIDPAGQTPFTWKTRIAGRDGNDTLIGGSGIDMLLGGDGMDWLEGNAGEDWLYGGADADHVQGGAGNDHFELQTVERRVERQLYHAVYG